MTEKLAIVRTNPTQGQVVKAQFWDEKNGLLGTGEFPFPLWLQFEKLVKDGMEARARVETRETRRIVVEFRPVEEKPAPVVYQGGVSNLAMEEEGEQQEAPQVRQGAIKPVTKVAKSLGGGE